MQRTKCVDNGQLIPEIVTLIREGRTVTLTVTGNSMMPFVKGGRDKVVLAEPENVRVGDVLLAFTEEKGYVIHRLVGMDAPGGCYVLMGDANLDCEHCLPAHVCAKVVELVRKGRRYRLEGRMWKTYSWLWVRLLPMRRYIMAMYRRLF